MAENITAGEVRPDLRRLAWRYGILILIPFVAGVAVLAIPDIGMRLAVGTLCGGLAVLAIVVCPIAFWKSYTGVPFRWFLVGATTWIIAVALKFTVAGIFYESGLAWLEASLPRSSYLGMGSIYGGLFTGIFEGGIVLVMVLIWKSLAREGMRAVAIGIGAGVCEAVLITFPVFMILGGLFSLFDQTTREQLVAAYQADPTLPVSALPWLVTPVERFYAGLGHVAFRTLILFGVATRHWRYFWYGFLLFILVDGLATYFDISGLLNSISTWWIELALAYNAFISIPIIIWCLKRWPAATAPQ